jgi:hypothetical protein
MRNKQYDGNQKIKPFFHCEAPSLRVKIIWVGFGIIEVLKKNKLPPGKYKTYMSKSVPYNYQTCNDKNIQGNCAYPPPCPEPSQIGQTESGPVVYIQDDIADEEAAQHKKETDLIKKRDKDKTPGKVTGYNVERVFLDDHEYAHGTHYVKAEGAPPVVYVNPEYVYDAFQSMI